MHPLPTVRCTDGEERNNQELKVAQLKKSCATFSIPSSLPELACEGLTD